MFSARENDGSISQIKKFMDGSYKVGIAVSLDAVGVRDVALAHIAGMGKPEASGRHLCVAEVCSLKDIGDAVTKNHPQFPGVKYVLPKALAYLLGPLALGMPVSKVRTTIGRPPIMDNSKIKRELGIEFNSLQQMVDDMLDSMEVKGMLAIK